MKRYEFTDLIELLRRLRDPETGCPWDLQQTTRSLVDYTLEEAYEVVDAVEQGDWVDLKEELGDLLLQIALYAQLAHEAGAFDLAAVVDTLVVKMIRRHPHVLPQGTLAQDNRQNRMHADQATVDAQAVSAQWQVIKAQERAQKNQHHSSAQNLSLLDHVPSNLPGLLRAYKLQKAAARVGFDWTDAQGVLDKLHEEVAECVQCMAAVNGQDDSQARDHLEEEIGDVLFTCVNLARHMRCSPERALRRANQKFTTRFQFIEHAMLKSEVTWERVTKAQLESWWAESKRQDNHLNLGVDIHKN